MDLKTKVDAMREVTKRKARLVALSNLELKSIRDTYAPTVNAKTVNLILALAAQERMIVYGLDIFGAFLNAEIGETVYLQLPKRLRMYNAQGDEHVWALKKSIYGLNRAPKAFYDTLCAHLIANGYNRFPLDPCLLHLLCPRRRLRHRSHAPNSDRRPVQDPQAAIHHHGVRQPGELLGHSHCERSRHPLPLPTRSH